MKSAAESDNKGTPAEATEFPFHLEEFKALKREIETSTATIVTLTQYVLLISAAIYSVVFGFGGNNFALGHVASKNQGLVLLLIPLLCSLVGGFVCIGIAFRIAKMGIYIHKLEMRFGCENLGWERQIRTTSAWTGSTTIIPWVGITVVNLAIPMAWYAGLLPSL
jgi:hypothetical protein